MSSGNGPLLNSSDQDLYDRQRATDKKSNEKVKEEMWLRRVFDQHSRELQESISTPIEPNDIFPVIRTGWFNYAFVLTILALAFFRKKFYTDHFNLIKEFVPCLFHVSLESSRNS